MSGGSGCADTTNKTVTFTSPPDVHFTAVNVNGCDSVTVTFTNNSSNAISYQWNFGDGSFSADTNPVHFYSQPGIYNVTLTAASPSGCSIAQSIINLVIVVSLPAIPIITQSGDTLKSSAAFSYQWYFNSNSITGATKQIYIPTADGDYSVTVSNADGCSSGSASLHVMLSGIADITIIHTIFHPNPVNDYLQIYIDNSAKVPAKADLTDMLGKVVWKESFSKELSKSIILDMREMSKNVYFLTFYYDDKMTVSKIIKQ